MTEKKNPYDTAYKLALEEFSALNLDDVSFNSSTLLDEDKLTVRLLTNDFLVTQGGKDIKCITENRDAKIAEKIILLHYLITSDGTALSREYITFENLSGANFYYPTYKARTIDILLRIFGNGLKRFGATAEKLGAKLEASEHKYKATFLILPNVPVNFIYWAGDKEAPASLQILYDGNITHYLPVEDIVVVTELLTHKIIRQAKEDKGKALYDYN